ncbi:MAG: cation-translocating P-type ATPase C-terminal domain-containing protein, partial [Chloroflexota bacterium]
QILWVNLVTDGLPGLALAQEQGEAGVMQRAPFKPTESVFSRGIGSKILWVGFIMGLVSLAVGYFAWVEEGRPGTGVAAPWQTMVFTTLVLAQMGNALAIRSGRESLFTIGIFSNRLMVFAVLTTFILQLALIYVPFLQSVFQTVALSAAELAICLASSTIVFISVEVYKWFYRRRNPLPTE